MKHALLGVAVPTYHRPELLRKLLDSIPRDIPVAVSDNGSLLSDNFRSEFAHVAFRGTTEVVPMFSNWNNAARMQSADWICLPSDDDLYLPSAFDIARRAISSHPSADMVVLGHHLIDGDGKEFSSWQPEMGFYPAPSGFSMFKYGVTARMPSIFFKRRIFERLGGFVDSLLLTAADSDFIQRAALVGNTLFVPEIISGYRVWEGSLTSKKIASTQWLEEIDQWCNNVKQFDAMHGCGMYTRHLQDEIFLQNLTVGVTMLRKTASRSEAFKHILGHRFPLRARPRSYARLALEVLRPSAMS